VVALAVYGTGLVALFACSALYHLWPGPVRFKATLRGIDHSTIFIFIAATYTPIAVLVLHGALAWVLLALVWIGATAGVSLSLSWIRAPRGLVVCCYLALGWAAVLAVPQLATAPAPAPLLLIVGGGLLYSIGALVYARRRPDPWPRTFGFHEVFHVLVIAAATCQYVAIAGWVMPAAR
jgi:hemolysin III